jgi:hypothetical protein
VVVPAGSQVSESTVPRSDSVAVTWRGVVLVALITLFIGLRGAWTAEVWADLWAALTITVGYAGILACAVLAVTLRGPGAMRRLEYGVLGLAIMLQVAAFPSRFPAGARPYTNDEGVLTDLAGRALQHGADPYARSWPQAFAGWDKGVTSTLSGHIATRFEYPPLAAILNALAQPLTRGFPTAGVVATAVLLLTTVVMFFLLPSPWRAVAPIICVGLGIYASYARLGYPTIIALPLLMVAVYRWTSIGPDGRLGRAGWTSALALGLAAATEQLAWFLVPFLVLAIFLLRRGDVPLRRRARLAGTYLVVVTVAFAVVNVPFAIWSFGDWLSGILSPLTQGAIPHGQGLIGVTYYWVGGSGALGFYSYAALLYAVGLMACFALYFSRLALAVAILPWTIFFFSIRSEDGYFILPVGLWAVSVLTADQSVLDRRHRTAEAERPAGAGRPTPEAGDRTAEAERPAAESGRTAGLRIGAWTRPGLAIAAFLPAAACLAVAIGTPQPLRLALDRPTAAGRHHLIATLIVRAVNVSAHAIAPHFALSSTSAASVAWIIESGPATLAARGTATYVIRAPFAAAGRPAGHRRIELRVFSTGPDTLSSAVVPPATARILPGA